MLTVRDCVAGQETCACGTNLTNARQAGDGLPSFLPGAFVCDVTRKSTSLHFTGFAFTLNMDTHMTRLFKLPLAVSFRGTLLGVFLAACSASPPGITRGVVAGAAGAVETAGAGGSAHAAGGDNAGGDNAGAGASAGETSHAAGAPDVESGGGPGSITAGGGGNAGATQAGASGAAASGGKAGESSAGSGGVGEESMVPCDVYAAYSVCRNCHVDPPLHGAPMPLLTLLDLQTFAVAEYQAISTGVMPAAGTLSAEDATLILGWLSSGAQGVTPTDCR